MYKQLVVLYHQLLLTSSVNIKYIVDCCHHKVYKQILVYFSTENKGFLQLNKMLKTQMNTKKLTVSLVAILSLVFLLAAVSAGNVATFDRVTVDGIDVIGTLADNASVIAGETVTVKVWFTAENDDTDVTLEAEIEGDKVDVDAMSEPFDVEANKTYKKTLTLKVPYELKDDISDMVLLNLELDGKEHNNEHPEVELRVQRPSYNAEVKSVTVSNNVEAGETIPVDVVIKNRGYNDLDDIYVTVSLPALGVEKSAYFGDIVSLEGDDCEEKTISGSTVIFCEDDDDDDEDTIRGRLYLKVPYSADEGIYALEVEVENDDTTTTEVKQIVINNDLSNNVVIASDTKTVRVGEDASYDLIVVNPTNKLKVYRIVTESTGDLTSSTNQAVVAVAAGSSQTVRVIASAGTEGTYAFNVNVFSGEALEDTVTLNATVEGGSVTNPVTVLTIVLAIVFIVLLIVLIVLVTKKPEKAEEFGESYY